MHVLDVTSTAFVRLLIIAAILAIPVLLAVAWNSGRRWRLVVAELVNSTGDPKLDGVTAGLTQLARQQIDIEIQVVSERQGALRAGLSGVRAGARRDAMRPLSPPPPVQRRIDNSLAEMLSAARDVAPQQAQPAVQLAVMLVSRPTGLLVGGIIQCRGGIASPRFGVTFDVLHLDGSTSVASETFWEPEAEPGAAADRSPQERLLELLRAAARWAAIQLVVHTVFPRGAGRKERGWDKVLLGMLLQQSADAYPPHAALFRRRAARALGEAADVLAKSPRPQPYLLAGIADTLDQLAAAGIDPDSAQPSSPSGYAQAHAAYAQAVAAMERMQPPDPGLLRRYQVRQAICWLASAQPGPRRQAIGWLSGPDMAPPEPETAEDSYDLACLYALASEVASEAARHPEWRVTAARFLVRALIADLRAKTLWKAAGHDRQLQVLHSALPGFKAAINDTLAGDRDPDGPDGADLDVEAIIGRALSG